MPRTYEPPAGEPSEWEQKLDEFGQKVEAGISSAAKSIKGFFGKMMAPSPESPTSASPTGKRSQSVGRKEDGRQYSTLPEDTDDFSVLSPTSPGLGQSDFKELSSAPASSSLSK